MPERRQREARAGKATAARWLAVMLLSAVAGALAGQLLSSPAPAAAAPVPAAGGRVFAIAGRVSADTYGLYLVDLEKRTICLYEYVAGERRLWLRAARTFHADVQLDSYNTMPLPKEVSKMVAESRRLKDVADEKKQ